MKWEYMILDADVRVIEEKLDALGQEGWEAFSASDIRSVDHHLRVLLKRPLKEEPKKDV